MKRYLKTPEAVIKALKDGKEVFLDEGGAGKVVLIDGFCVKQWNDQFNINYTINLRDKPYIFEEEKTFEIKVGEWYETRNHKKARCYNNSYFFTIDNYTVFMTDTKGFFRRKQVISDLDIIAHWDK